MAIIFHNDSAQAGGFVKIRKKSNKTATTAAQSAALIKLRQFLNASEPELVYWLQNNWMNQSNAITYKELREAIMNGSLDQQIIYDWQQDYSKFVVDHLLPAWAYAMEEATTQLSRQYPLYSFDPATEGVKQWMDTKAASFVTNSTAEQIKAINAVVARASLMQDMSVDGLARAIRPMVGLTKPQALANLRYYESMIDSGLSEKAALERSVRYSARQSRYRGYNIARTELAFAYNKGEHFGVQQAIDQGYMGHTKKVWCTADDERTCDVCGGLEGKEIEMEEDFDFYTKLHANNPGIRQTPPAHPSCRCTALYIEVSPPDYKAWNEQNAPQTAQEPQEDDYNQPTIPTQANIPDAGDLKLVGPAHMGGTSESYIYEDISGMHYLFKVAQDKGMSNTAPFRAYIQEAAYKVQYIVDPDTAVDLSSITLNGKFGTIQRIIEKSGDADELKNWFLNGGAITQETVSQLQREHVTDWLLANYDGHVNNFITDQNGTLVGLDKEQAMKYIKQKEAQTMSTTYHPNKIYGELEPVYNKLYRGYAKGVIDLNLNDTLPYIKRVEAIPDKQYREVFREYAESLHGKGKEAEELLDAIVERKKQLRETYRSFYEELIEKRTGKKSAFQFLDEAPKARQQTLSVVTMTEEAASRLTTAELKKIAKSNNVPNFGNMTKKQLVTCISDPSKVEEMSNQVKLKLQAQAAKRRAANTGIPNKKQAITGGVNQAEDIFDDLDNIPKGVNGINVRADYDALEGQNLTIRRIVVNGDDYIEINGKLTEDAWNSAKNRLDKAGARRPKFVYEKGTIVDDTMVFSNDVLWSGNGMKLQIGNTDIEIADDRDMAQKGLIRIRVKASGGTDTSQALQALQKVGLDFITENPTAEADKLMRQARLLWQRNPKLSAQFSNLKDKLAQIENYLKQAGIDPKDASKLIQEEVFDGYSTYMDYQALDKYRKAGLEYVWAGVGNERSVAAIIKGGGMQATKRRMVNGFMGNGASMTSDIATGGADSVFTRIATKGAYKADELYAPSFASGNYQIIFKDSIMARTDWYSYSYDNFGDVRDLAGRKPALDFVKEMNTCYMRDNEIMFRAGIRVEDWAGIDTGTQAKKDALINALQKEGITKINGIPLDKFIRVNKIVGKPLK